MSVCELISWTVVVPLKPVDERKSRLAPRCDSHERKRIADEMAMHVLATIEKLPAAQAILLSTERPDWWTGEWRDDRGLELNAAIDAARRALSSETFAVLHADLPRLTAADCTDLLAVAATEGLAIAPDRHGIGTNAIAIADRRPFRFAFGKNSLALHRAQGGAVVHRPGLALDIDTPDDLEFAEIARAAREPECHAP